MTPHYHRLTNAELVRQAGSQKHDLLGLTQELANRLATLMKESGRLKALEAQLDGFSLEHDEAVHLISALGRTGLLNSGHLSRHLDDRAC